MKASIKSVYYDNNDCAYTRKIRNYSWLLALGWSALIGASCYWNVTEQRRVLLKVAKAEAQAAIGRDLLYRRWVSSQGGIYVQVNDKTRPNPYLSNISERDIRTSSGKALTLVNPAYMTRMVYEFAKQQNSFIGRGHLTSLKPIRPENASDPWEEKVLRSFEQGVTESSEIETIDGKSYMRLMRPFITENSCLKCHAVQGYRVGDVRGGLSVSIPIQPLLEATHTQIAGTILTHVMLWLLGVGLVGLAGRQLFRSALAQREVEAELHEQARQMEEEIAERQRVQEALQESQAHLQIVADYASNWEYWRLPGGTFLYISPSVATVTGYTVEEFMNNAELLSNVVHPDDREMFRHHTHVLDEEDNIQPIEIRIVRKDGAVRWVGHVCRQVFNSDALPCGWRASNQDITHNKQMEHELFEQTEQLEEEVAEREAAQEELGLLNRSLEERVSVAVADLRGRDKMLIQQSRLAAMGEMINNIAHQWRQPLNNIALIIQNLELSFSSGMITREEMASDIGKAMGAVMHMSRTIDDFRNFFREDKEKHDFMVNRAISRTLEFISAALLSRNILVEVEADHEVTTLGYQNEYLQVLLNIISNTTETSIERCVDCPRIFIRVTSENGRSVVYIRDNCGGIRNDVLPKIFDPYFTTRSPDKGSGIGLYMSKVIIEQNMGGQLTARNVESGVEFRIEV